MANRKLPSAGLKDFRGPEFRRLLKDLKSGAFNQNPTFESVTVDNITLNGNAITVSGALSIDGLTWPTSDGVAGEVLSTDGAGTLSFVAPGSFDLSAETADTVIGAGDFMLIHDGSNKKITRLNVEASLDHDNLSNFVANEHINHSSVSITAGAGLTGGGDLTSTRTLDVGAGTGITVNADDIAVNTGAVDHNSLLNYVANEHIDWTSTSSNLTTTGTAATGNLSVTGTIAVTSTVDGRDIATDGSKLDGIEAAADVTDETNVTNALSGATLATVTAQSTDKILIQDVSDLDNLKVVTVSDVASGGSDTFSTIQVDGSVVSTNAPTLDFDGTDFSLTESPTDDFDITINEERIEDIVGAMVTGNTETLITVTYQGADGTLDFVVDEASINHDSLAGFVANEHIDWTSASSNFSTSGSVTVSSTNGIDCNPGSDTNCDLITVGVTGSPKIAWDEASTRFNLNASQITSVNFTGFTAYFVNDGNASSRQGIYIQCGADIDTGGQYYIRMYDGDGNEQGRIWNNTAGNMQLVDISDVRLKDNITEANAYNIKKILNGIKRKEYTMYGGKNRRQGFIAQEVEKYLPEAVSTEPGEGIRGVAAADPFTRVLWQFAQEQLEINQELKRELTNLKNKLLGD